MSSREVTVLIADDEAPARKRLRTLLEDYNQFRITGEAENGDQVLKYIIEKKPDVAFLDINMPGASVFNTLPSLRNPPLIVFQTAYSQYGADAFDIDAVDYLLKPVARERFSRAVEKLLARLVSDTPRSLPQKENDSDVLSVKSGESLRIIQIEKIRRISFEEGFCFLHCTGEKIYSDKPLSHYADQLEGRGFYQVSRSDLINLKKMVRLHPYFNGRYIVELTGGEKIPVSRRRVQGLKEKIGG